MPSGRGQAHSGGEQHRSGRADRRAVHPLQVWMQGHSQRCRWGGGGGGDLQLHCGREAWRVRGGPTRLPLHHQTLHAQVRSRQNIDVSVRPSFASVKTKTGAFWKNTLLFACRIS